MGIGILHVVGSTSAVSPLDNTIDRLSTIDKFSGRTLDESLFIVLSTVRGDFRKHHRVMGRGIGPI